jgi:hypothetical protein
MHCNLRSKRSKQLSFVNIIKGLLYWILVSVLLWSAGVAGLIIFGTAQPPPSAPTITGPFSRIDQHALPELRRYRARDGAQLSFREYPAAGDQVAVLIHGSAGSSVDMHPLALALQQVGVTVLVPDLRGHGANRPHGDIAPLRSDHQVLGQRIRRRAPGTPSHKLGRRCQRAGSSDS